MTHVAHCSIVSQQKSVPLYITFHMKRRNLRK